MIVLTRLNGTRFAVNPDILERIHESPDTHLVTLDGAAYVVRETLAEVVELIAEYRASVLRRAHDLPAVTGYPLSLVRSSSESEETPSEDALFEDGPDAAPDIRQNKTPNHPTGR